MDPSTKSIALFILACIPTRLAATYVAKNHQGALPTMAVIALIIAIGFATIYMNGWRKTGGETFGEAIWWNDLRPVHSLLYFLFSYLAIYDPTNAWKALALDVAVGTAAFINFRLL